MRELRIGFAMGGGVSLGTFCGAALSEALKLAVLRARPRSGGAERYERVVIDVFSGASAGAMALAIMLRTLVHITPEQRAAALASLTTQFGDELLGLTDAARADLVAAQVVQDTQHRVWSQEITLDRLLGGGRSLRYEAGLLDRGAVEAVARSLMSFDGLLDFAHRPLLGERVLFAATLSNVTAILADATREYDSPPEELLGLSDGLISRCHRELRVFDLNFGAVPRERTSQPEQYPERWCRYHAAPEEEQSIGDLRTPRTWARIAATAIAAGAFPFAFEPVVLTRSRYEYGTLWPRELAGRDSYPFTYVDGGTFNNEPIREAFRLAAFMDAQTPDADFDRWIVFVDPNVGEPRTDLRVAVHRSRTLQDPGRFGSLDGYDLVERATLDRLLPLAGDLVGAILDEAQVREPDRIFQARGDFARRDRIRALIAGLNASPTDDLLTGLLAFCREELARALATETIPPGGVTVAAELERVIGEETRSDPADPLGALRGRAAAFVAAPAPAADPRAALWLRALLAVAVDLLMDLEGKRARSTLVAIAPIRVRAGSMEILALPGGRLHGFGGFASDVPDRYEGDLARHCTRQILEAASLVRQGSRPAPPEPEFTAAEERAYQRDLDAGLRRVDDRIGEMVRDAELLRFFPHSGQLILLALQGSIRRLLSRMESAGRPPVSFELHLEVPDRSFELDGAGVGDRDLGTIRPTGRGTWRVVTFAGHDGTRWQGPFLDRDRQSISVDRAGRLPGLDRDFCRVALPTSEQCQAALCLPNPVFVARLTEADAGLTLGSERWTLEPGVTPLEETVFGPLPVGRPPDALLAAVPSAPRATRSPAP